MIIADAPALSQPRLYIHLLVKLGKALSQAITHNNPAKIVLGRLQGISKVGNTNLQHALVHIGRGIVPAAACDNAGSQYAAKSKGDGLHQLLKTKFTHILSPI